jgi:hypothetical protein
MWTRTSRQDFSASSPLLIFLSSPNFLSLLPAGKSKVKSTQEKRRDKRWLQPLAVPIKEGEDGPTCSPSSPRSHTSLDATNLSWTLLLPVLVAPADEDERLNVAIADVLEIEVDVEVRSLWSAPALGCSSITSLHL